MRRLQVTTFSHGSLRAALCFSLMLVTATVASGRILRSTVETECSNSYLWSVRTQPPIYLFGTLHVPYSKIWDDIPQNVKAAFSGSDSVCLELLLSDKDTLSALSDCQYLPEGQTIDQIIAPELYQRIIIYFDRIEELYQNWLGKPTGLFFPNQNLFRSSIAGWEQKLPIWILVMLSSFTEYNVKNRNTPLLDHFIDNAAKGMGKEVVAVESVQEQCNPLNSLNNSDVEVALTKLLDYLEPLVLNSTGPVSDTEEIISCYRCGDFMARVNTESILPLPKFDMMPNLLDKEKEILQRINDYLEEQMIVIRNRKMAAEIHSLLMEPERNKTYFFALGAGHFVGKKNVVSRLRKKGYTVDLIAVDVGIEGPSLPEDIIALGDPKPVPQILKIGAQATSAPPSPTFATLSMEEINEIFNRVIGHSITSSTEQPTTAPSEENGESLLTGRSTDTVLPHSSGLTAVTTGPASNTIATSVIVSQGISTEDMDNTSVLVGNASSAVRWQGSCYLSLLLTFLVMTCLHLR